MFDTPLFWLICLVVVGILCLVETPRIRAIVFSVSSLFALSSLLGLSPAVCFGLLASTIWVAIGTKWTMKWGREHPFIGSCILFLPVLIFWVVGKTAVAYEYATVSMLFFAGLSYFLVKTWTLIKDIYDGQVKNPDFFIILSYFTFFPAYVSGPMHYYNEFEQTVLNPQRLNVLEVVNSGYRLLLGLIKIKLISPLVQPFSLIGVLESNEFSIMSLIVGSYAYSIVIYMDFSGYSDLAIATSRLLAIKMPENFNQPYRAVNIRDFWQRWHITFTRVLTSYIFIPVSRLLQKVCDGRDKVKMASAYLITFGICGFWHGPTVNFLVWGIYHAVGLIIYDLYRTWGLKRRAPGISRHVSERWKKSNEVMAIGGTMTFVSLGWILFVLPISFFTGG